MPLASGTRLGSFEILAPIGAGGMGEVYRARDHRLERDVAIKVLSGENEDALKRLEREARIIAALSHPNILAVHQFDTEGGISYIATELLEGESLRDRVSHSRIGWKKAAEIGAAIAEAVGAAHGKGVIHRDLKPENIFLTSDARVKVLDFGLARASAEFAGDAGGDTMRRTAPGTVLGTIGYMSPEQVRGETASERSDIFSLGCVLFEMVTGTRPFQHATAAETMAAILREEPPQYEGDAPPELMQLIRRCLEKSPDARIQSARDLAFDLAHLARGDRPAAAAIDSIAVLPFENAANNPEIDYLGEGMMGSIMSRLSQLPRLRVMARSTVYRYQSGPSDPLEIGRALKVRSVLTGRLVQRGEMLTIWAELVNVADGSQFWSERYHRKVTDLLSVEEEIAREISEKLRIRLTGKDEERLARTETKNTEAYQAYLKGRHHWGKRTDTGFHRALEFFKEALEKDPTYALAYVGLADTYNLMGFYSLLAPRDAFSRGEAAARRAVELNESLSEGHTSLAYAQFLHRWDFVAAERGLRRAVELNPHYPQARLWYSFLLSSKGRVDEVPEQVKAALEADPLSLAIGAATAWHLYLCRRYEQSMELMRKTIAMEPSFGLAHVWLALTLRMLGRLDEAVREAELGVERTETKAIAYEALAIVQATAGRRDAALKTLDNLVEYSASRYLQPYYLATIHTTLGNHDEAISWLFRALSEHSHLVVTIDVDPVLDPLRPDPRFEEILRQFHSSRSS